MRWTGRRGGSRRAGWGALAGGLIGAVIGLPIPIIGSVVGSFLGSFAGALVAEYSVTRNSGLAGRVAWGALVGRVVGTAVKMSLTVVMAGVLIYALRPGNRDRFDAAARLPLADNEEIGGEPHGRA